MTTSKKDAHKASKLLKTSKSATVRSVAGSDLAQSKHKGKAGECHSVKDSVPPPSRKKKK